MNPIFTGIIIAILNSISSGNRKKSIDISTLSKTLFKWFAYPYGAIFIGLLVYFIGINFAIFTDYKYLLFLIGIVIIGIANTYLYLHILKSTKVSVLMPYSDIDKVFVIILGFFIFSGTERGVSIITLLISIFTVFFVFLVNTDIKTLKVPKIIGLYILHKLIYTVKVLCLSFVLIKYSSLTVISVNWLTELFLYTSIAIILKDSLSSIFNQSKEFYLRRGITVVLGRGAGILGLFIIQTSGIIIATLIGFLAVVFNILSMKFILNDTPTKKQITSAFVVLFLIGFGYYFK